MCLPWSLPGFINPGSDNAGVSLGVGDQTTFGRGRPHINKLGLIHLGQQWPTNTCKGRTSGNATIKKATNKNTLSRLKPLKAVRSSQNLTSRLVSPKTGHDNGWVLSQGHACRVPFLELVWPAAGPTESVTGSALALLQVVQ